MLPYDAAYVRALVIWNLKKIPMKQKNSLLESWKKTMFYEVHSFLYIWGVLFQAITSGNALVSQTLQMSSQCAFENTRM